MWGGERGARDATDPGCLLSLGEERAWAAGGISDM